MFGKSKFDLLYELYESEKEQRKGLSDRVINLELANIELQKIVERVYTDFSKILVNHKAQIENNTKVLSRITDDPFESAEWTDEDEDKNIN